MNRTVAAFYFLRLREIIAIELEAESVAMFGGEIEVDDSYFGGKRKGKRGRGTAGKIPVFGLLKRGERVDTKTIPDASSATLLPIIGRKVVPDSIVYSDSWRGYNVLDISDFHHFRITHSHLFADKQNHISGIEHFLEPGQAAHAQIQRSSEGWNRPIYKPWKIMSIGRRKWAQGF